MTWTVLLLAISIVPQVRCIDKITVAFSKQEPFVSIDQSGRLKGLDVSIITNFAQKLNLKVEFLFINASLNYILSNEKIFEAFPDRFILRCDFI